MDLVGYSNRRNTMKKIAIIASMLLFAASVSAYGIATFTGRLEYLGYNRLLCEYITSEGMVFTVVVQTGYCPNSISI
jgi:hypothetical protein